MKNFIGFCCIKCGAEEKKNYRGMTCPYCKGNMDVVYDYARIRKTVSRSEIEGQGMDRYRPLLPVKKNTPFVPLRVGDTPLYPVPSAGHPRLFLKDETHEPSGSFKDRAGFIALAKALEWKKKIVAGASTGNAASSLASLAASIGQRVKIFVPYMAPQAKVTQLLIYGAEVYLVRGNYDQAFELCTRACEEYGWMNRNTGLNPFTREGKKTCAYEIAEQLGWKSPDRVYIPTGDGNILSGIWKGFNDLLTLGWIRKKPRMVAVQSSRSAAIARAFRKGTGIRKVRAATIADSISVDIPRDGEAALKALRESNGYAVTVPDGKILEAMQELGRKTGIFAEPAAAAAYAGWKQDMKDSKKYQREIHIVVLTGNGLKDIKNAIRAARSKPHLRSPDFSRFRP